MCGITGFYNGELKKEKFIESTNLIKHRGPDEEGFYFDDVAFGHRRLVVIDKQNGKQPMKIGNYVLVYNGELYNTKSLKEELIKLGYTFTGTSDTEVLLKSYIEWKEEAFVKLNGIYAFAIYDGEKVILVRDRLGVKPLYYSNINNELFFSSEIKSILKYYDLNTVNDDGLRELLGLGPSHTAGITVYKDVYEVKPGEYLEFIKDVKKKIYWNVEAKPFTDDFASCVKKVKYLLTDSIERQLVSDVGISTFLSGGVDSSIITAIAAKANKNLQSYSIEYEDNDFEANDFQVSKDIDYIKYMVERYDLDHKYLEISLEELAEYLKEAVDLRDFPGMADIDSSLLWFCKKVKKENTVALSGECADEIFAGYPWFYRDTGSDIFPWLRNLKMRENLLKDEWIERLKLEDYVKDKYEETLKEVSNLNEHQKMMYLNIKWFMTTLLDRKDRMSMGASLEVRVPFSDHLLVEYLFNVPQEFKHYKQEKGLLREAMADLLPAEILNRKKNPYPKTHNEKYTKIVANLLTERLNDESSILNILFKKDKLIDLIKSGGTSIDKPWFGQLMTGPQLIAYLYQFDYWFSKYKLKLG